MTMIQSNVIIFLCLLLSPLCFAMTSGNKDPISIQSDTLELNQQQGVATYFGKVLLKQSGKELTADKMIIYRNAQGKLEKILAFGKPAKYVGTEKEELLFGEANKITFLSHSQEMILEDQAKITQKRDSFTAPYINYNLQSKIIHSKAQEGIRPTIIFHPN